jgi:hypothetical protein
MLKNWVYKDLINIIKEIAVEKLIYFLKQNLFLMSLNFCSHTENVNKEKNISPSIDRPSVFEGTMMKMVKYIIFWILKKVNYINNNKKSEFKKCLYIQTVFTNTLSQLYCLRFLEFFGVSKNVNYTIIFTFDSVLIHIWK